MNKATSTPTSRLSSTKHPRKGYLIFNKDTKMIDGIKTKDIQIPNQNLLDWSISVNEKDGEILPQFARIAKYKGLMFINKKDKTYLKGSLHKFFNDGLHNYNDFNFSDLVRTINRLQELFSINPAKVYLENLEFGVNIILPFTPDKVINSLVIHKGEPFKTVASKYTGGKGSAVECVHGNYIIKIYDKGTQYDQNQNILRIEIKAIKMAYFQFYKIPIETLADLLKTDNLQGLSRLLLKMVNDCLFVDPSLLFQENINEPDKLILARGSNANYWNQLKPKSKNFEKGNKDPDYNRTHKKYYKELGRFENLLNKYESNLKTQIVKLTGDKLTDLLKVELLEPTKGGDKLTDLIELPQYINEGDKLTDLNQSGGTNSPLVYSVNLSLPKNRVCPVTGLDISMQKDSSKFLSIAGIKYYYLNDEKTFQLLEKRLSNKWQSENLFTRITEIAHSIRNEFNNPKHNYQRDSEHRGRKLFDDTHFFSERLTKSILNASNY